MMHSFVGLQARCRGYIVSGLNNFNGWKLVAINANLRGISESRQFTLILCLWDCRLSQGLHYVWHQHQKARNPLS